MSETKPAKKAVKKAAERAITTWLDNQTKLADALGTTRRTISQCLRDYPDSPKARPDGKWPLEPWQDFFKTHNIKGAADDQAEDVEQQGADESGEKQPSLTSVKIRKMLLECERLRMDNDERAGKLSDPTAQLHAFGLAVNHINTQLETFKVRCRPKLVSIKDEHEVEEILNEEIQVLISNLRDFDFPAGEEGEE